MSRTPIFRPAVLLGLAIGGFFDGILLHQILQWHHLFSGVDDWASNIALQITLDGVFHVAMFMCLLAGLCGALRRRPSRGVLGSALIGFGAWHALDAILSHWILGIHRIKDAAENPLVWDVGWVFVFGLVPLLLGYLHLHNIALPRRVPTICLAIFAAVLGAINTFPVVQPGGATIVAFAPGTNFSTVSEAAHAVGARLINADITEQVWAMDIPKGSGWWRLYLHGAVMVGRGPAAGCLKWTQI